MNRTIISIKLAGDFSRAFSFIVEAFNLGFFFICKSFDFTLFASWNWNSCKVAPNATLTNEGDCGNAAPDLSRDGGIIAALAAKLNHFKNLLVGEFVVRAFFAKSFAIGIYSFCSPLPRAVAHVVFSCAHKKMIWTNALGIVARVADLVRRFNRPVVENEAGNMRPHHARFIWAFSNYSIFLALRPKPAAVSFHNSFCKTLRKCRGAFDGCQKFWRNKFGVQPPINKLGFSHA